MEDSDFADMVVPDTEDSGARDDTDFDSRQTPKTGSTQSKGANISGNSSTRRKEIANATECDVKMTMVEENRTCDELKMRKRKHKHKHKHKKMKTRMEERDITLRDSHPQEPFEASPKIRKENDGGIKSDNFGKEGKEEDSFYPSLLRSSLADKGLDFASLEKATKSILVGSWNKLMLASSIHEQLRAKFDEKLFRCICGVYEGSIKNSTTPHPS